MIDTQGIIINRIDHLPDSDSPESKAFSKQGDSNLIVDIHTRQLHTLNHRLPFSIRSVFNGTGYYNGRNSHYAVNDLNYLLVNEGSSYSYFVDSEAEVNLFSISFSDALTKGVFYYLTHYPIHLPDDPNYSGKTEIELIEKLYTHNHIVSPSLFKLRKLCRNWTLNEELIKEQLYFLLEAIFLYNRTNLNEINKIRASKLSTRRELYTRLHRAKDYIYSCYKEDLKLEQMARVACLNPYYFLRQYKNLFNYTPHKYLQYRKIQEASKLMRHDLNMSISDICNAVGFTDLASFSKLFKKYFGRSPQKYRSVLAPRGKILFFTNNSMH
jgi:AraC-like DNA-binding protein